MTPKTLRTIINEMDDRCEGKRDYRLSLFLKDGTRLTGMVQDYADAEFIAIDVDRINGRDLGPEADCLPGCVEVDSIAAVMLEG